MPVSIFVSYSHQDSGLVKPVVGLLRGTKDLVFQDIDNIRPGTKWRRQIEDALHAAHVFVLFWCYHSSRSTEVKKEYKLALSTGKDVLPVLLDTTPLPDELNEFQWVDFRQLVGSRHQSSKRWLILTALVVVLIGFSFFVTFWPQAPQPPLPQWPPASQPRFGPWQLSAIFFLILLLVLPMLRNARVMRRAPSPMGYQEEMAATLRLELLKREMRNTQSQKQV
jgi:hypothetical protein